MMSSFCKGIDSWRMYWYAILPVQIAYFTGLRLGEVAGLTWQDINLEEQYLTVRRSIRYNARTPPTPLLWKIQTWWMAGAFLTNRKTQAKSIAFVGSRPIWQTIYKESFSFFSRFFQILSVLCRTDTILFLEYPAKIEWEIGRASCRERV